MGSHEAYALLGSTTTHVFLTKADEAVLMDPDRSFFTEGNGANEGLHGVDNLLGPRERSLLFTDFKSRQKPAD